MKKILSILGTIGLTATSTTSLISCEKPKSDNNNENGGNNKLTPNTKPEPQEPPKNSNWKLITDYNSFENNVDNKYYFVGWKNTSNEWKIAKFKHDTSDVKKIGEVIYVHSIKYYAKNNNLKGLYRWNGNGEPQIPAINSNTGQITDWKG
ncbi:lipoprotein [Spiroplasma melliferum]|uniref:lipoprotein n=1 Tax=Spiroplasma melliferum TaxID=2134 RepID=UPI0015E0B636|nr:lipoprotein [Spiroplasma melliferum]